MAARLGWPNARSTSTASAIGGVKRPLVGAFGKLACYVGGLAHYLFGVSRQSSGFLPAVRRAFPYTHPRTISEYAGFGFRGYCSLFGVRLACCLEHRAHKYSRAAMVTCGCRPALSHSGVCVELLLGVAKYYLSK